MAASVPHPRDTLGFQQAVPTPPESCGKLLGRDENAAHNILYIFQQQYEDKDGTVPSKFRPTTKL
jgi:hypothetical protein